MLWLILLCLSRLVSCNKTRVHGELCLSINMPYTFSEVVRYCMLLTTVGTTAHLLITYHSRWVHHSEQRLQYEALAASPLCLDPSLRLQSSEVNNCATAERAVNGGTLSPAVLALLQTLQELSLCSGETEPHSGVSKNRCDLVVKALIDSSMKVLILAVLLVVAMLWAARQYTAIVHARNTKLPLDDPDYPVAGHVAPWLKETLLKED